VRVLVALLIGAVWAGVLTPAAGLAGSPSVDPWAASAQQLARMMGADGPAVGQAAARAHTIDAQPAPAAAFDAARLDMQRGDADFRFREAIRDEQNLVYRLAGDTTTATAVLAQLPPGTLPGLAPALDGLRGAWKASGVTDPTLVRPRLDRRFLASEPVAALHGYYQGAAAEQGIDWTYLAAINYVETDFGRTLGPSAAGAEGPMQFLPSTWQVVGEGGDIMSAHDSIWAAARYLRRAGAPADYERAVLSYNHDADYLQAIQGLAGAMRADPLWLERLYYWSTYG
jgi:membrane-bound lytic murein transglycosylase B